MTLLEVIDAARILLNEPLSSGRTFPDNTSSFWTDSQLTTFHNLIQQELQQTIVQADEDYFVTQSFLSIVAGTAEYALPTNTIKVVRVEDNRDVQSPQELQPVTINNRGLMYPPSFFMNSQATWNGGYYLRGQQIVLTDTPNYTNASAIRLHFVRRLADVSNGSDTSELPGEHHRALVWGVVKYALFQEQAEAAYVQASGEYEKMVTRIQKEVEARQIQRPRRVTSLVNNAGWEGG